MQLEIARPRAHALRIPRPVAYGVLLLMLYALGYTLFKLGVEGAQSFPWGMGAENVGRLGNALDSAGRSVSWLFNPLAAALDSALVGLEAFLLWLPWATVVAATSLVALRLGGRRMALFCLVSLMFIGMMGLWDSTMITLSLIGVSVFICVAVGVPLGIIAALSNRFEAALRPILDTMQVMPAFVYLMPVMILFGVGGAVSVALTVIYATPPAIRLTNLGIRGVASQVVDTARSFGSTWSQILFHVQLPLAKPSIMMGINQVIMMALAMVIITAVVGSSGLGRDVWYSLRTINTGAGLEAGIAIVILAVILDRLSYSLARQDVSAARVESQRGHSYSSGGTNAAVEPARMPVALQRRFGFAGLFAAIVLGVTAASVIAGTREFPDGLRLSLAEPVNSAVGWMTVNLYFFTSWLRDSVMREFGLGPIQSLLEWLPWQAFMLGVALLAYFTGGTRAAVVALLGVLFIGIGGVWELAMETLGQVLTAVAVSVVIGFALGIWVSQNDTVEAAIRPVLDTMQTMPVFVYLIPVIMLWGSGPMASIIATIVYALPPAIRMTNLGIRQVPSQVVETALSHGATRSQILVQVQIPMAVPTIMMGVNQCIMMALSMVIIGGLVGGGGLGQEVYVSAIYLRLGPGLIAGMAIVVLAMILDRMTQGRTAVKAS